MRTVQNFSDLSNDSISFTNRPFYLSHFPSLSLSVSGSDETKSERIESLSHCTSTSPQHRLSHVLLPNTDCYTLSSSTGDRTKTVGWPSPLGSLPLSLSFSLSGSLSLSRPVPTVDCRRPAVLRCSSRVLLWNHSPGNPGVCLRPLSPIVIPFLQSSHRFRFSAMTDGHLFNNISLGGRGGTNPGQLKIYSGGILWKKQGGGKAIDVDKADIMAVTWMKVPRTNQLGVRIKDGLYYKFTGFRDQDVTSLTNFFQSTCGITPEEKQLSVCGRNWGEVDLNGNMLTFMVGSKQAFEVSLADVSQTQLQGKNDVILEFHVDDTTGANEKDSLMEISFHIPNSNTQFVGDENHPPAQVFRDKIMSMADVGAGGEEAVVTFEGIAILTPRGRYNVELQLSFLRLQGQANDFKIQYSSVVRLFLLPKSNQPHTFVVVTLDPPIRKGQTLYPHIVLQFETDYVVDNTLSISEDLFNTKYKDKLESSYKGLIHEVFTTIMRGLSGAKVTKPGKFRSCQDGYAVKSSLKAEDGVLYPLEKSFFFLPKPPTLILHEEIDYVEFERHAAGGSNMHYFDLLIRLKTEQEHLFRNIQRNEYHNLFDFISGKGLKIMNLGDAQTTDGVARVLQDEDDDAVDPHLERIKNLAGGDESDEEDEDFVLDKDDGGSPTDDSGAEESDASESGDEKEKPAKKESKKETSSSKASSSKKKTKEGDEDGSKKKKQRKKKDPNAPKRAMTGFMFFSQMERENLKKTNPGISFTEVGRVLGDKWKKMTVVEKEPYEARALQDKKRYKDEISGYKNPQPMNIDSGNESGSA